MNGPIRILVVEDHIPTRELILEHLRSDPKINVVGETHDGREAVLLAREHRPDVVLMDLSIVGMNGLKATELIRRACAETQVLVLTNYGFQDMQQRARESNQLLPASAFLMKDEIASRCCA